MESTAASPAGTDAGNDLPLKPLLFLALSGSMAMMAFVALVGPIARLLRLAPWQIGAALTAAGVLWVVMARFWGAMSDRRGRRPVLLAGLAGFAISYLLLALFVDFALHRALAPLLAFAGILVGRSAVGLFYAAVPPTTAAVVADHVPPAGRAAAMAAVGAASATGMVAGPGLAGLLAPAGLALPLYGTALLPVLAWLVLWRALPREAAKAPSRRQRLPLLDRRLRRPLAVAFVALFSVTIAQIIVGFFALDRLHLDPAAAARVAGVALTLVGLALVAAQMLLRRLRWPPARLIRVGGTLAGLGFASTMLAASPPMLWASYALAAFGMGFVYPSISALAANAVEAHEQGVAAGSVAAAQGLGSILGPITGTALYGLDSGAPYALIGALLLATALWPLRAAPARH